MPNCIKCQCHYRLDEYNNSLECVSCQDVEQEFYIDDEDQVDVDMLMNPTGVTKAVFYE